MLHQCINAVISLVLPGGKYFKVVATQLPGGFVHGGCQGDCSGCSCFSAEWLIRGCGKWLVGRY